MATMVVKNGSGGDETVEKPLAPGRAAAASSRPVALSTEDKTALDAAVTAVQLIDDSVATLGTTTYTEATTKGMIIGAVRRDADTTLANTTNEIAPLQVDANGYLKVEIFDGGGSHTVDNAGTFAVQVDGSALTALQLIDNIVLAEDAAHASGDPGVMALAVRSDTPSAKAADGDYTPILTDSTGRLHTKAVITKSDGTIVDPVAAVAGGIPVIHSLGEYETVAASQTAQTLGATGGTGDYITGILVVPATTSPGNVLLLDNATSITVFAGGASSVSNLVPFFIPLGAVSVSGAWKITTGANVSCIAFGNFT